MAACFFSSMRETTYIVIMEATRPTIDGGRYHPASAPKEASTADAVAARSRAAVDAFLG